jgi:hypothetical protein
MVVTFLDFAKLGEYSNIGMLSLISALDTYLKEKATNDLFELERELEELDYENEGSCENDEKKEPVSTQDDKNTDGRDANAEEEKKEESA